MIKWVEAVAILAGFGLLQILIWILSFLEFAKPDVLRETIEKKIVQSPDKITLNSQNDHKILAFLKGKKEVSFTAITQQSQLRKTFGSSDSILSELETLADQNLIIFEKPSNVRGTWTVKGI